MLCMLNDEQTGYIVYSIPFFYEALVITLSSLATYFTIVSDLDVHFLSKKRTSHLDF